MTRGWKLAVGLVAGLLVANGALRGLESVTGGSPGGPASSSYATGDTGIAAWAALLSRSGHPVGALRVKPSEAALDPATTAVVLEPPDVLAEDAEALRAFVAAGGRLVAGGGDVLWLRTMLSGAPELSVHTAGLARPLAPLPEVDGVDAVRSAGDAAFDDVHGAVPLLGDDDATLAAVGTLGAGRVVVLADPSPLQNAYLDRDDNARFALAIAGPRSRPIVFFETYHGYGPASGLAAVPTRWRALLGFGTLAALVFILARARRLGPAELEARELDPPRREYVEALAGILQRTRSPELALAELQAETRRRLARRAGSDEPVAAARSLGLPQDEADAVAREPLRKEDVLPLGRALARLASTGRRDRWQS
jgi:hypothetical protein